MRKQFYRHFSEDHAAYPNWRRRNPHLLGVENVTDDAHIKLEEGKVGLLHTGDGYSSANDEPANSTATESHVLAGREPGGSWTFCLQRQNIAKRAKIPGKDGG